jgi:hypothetical protein
MGSQREYAIITQRGMNAFQLCTLAICCLLNPSTKSEFSARMNQVQVLVVAYLYRVST